MTEMNISNIPVSFGGGVNSTALVILLAQRGWRGPVLFADTGAESEDTYAYLNLFGNWLSRYDLKITVVGEQFRESHYRMNLLCAMETYCQIPLMRARWCTTAYKIDPIKRWCSWHGYDFDSVLVGIAWDEAHRQPDKIRPLVEWRITRDDCARIIKDAGLPVPPKSGCWCCPFQSRSQWQMLWERYPERFFWLAWLERRATFSSGRQITFSPNGESLFEMAQKFRMKQPTLFDMTDFYQPCLCRV